MDLDYGGIYQGFGMGFSFVGASIRLLVGILVFCMVFYAFMLILKARVLKDTVDVKENAITKAVLTVNLFITIGGAILSFILILL